jgi:photosystem II stability/assembly factor-like uncharacterized protein
MALSLLSLLLTLPSSADTWQRQTIATDADFRGICAVSSQVAWASGTRGTFARTTDGGATWQVGTVPGAEKLDFRDVEAFTENMAYLLSIGPGENSRIYKTTDGGKNWTLQFKNPDKDAFYDALAFWDPDTGIALSDPVNGRFRILATHDGGATWKPLPEDGMPPALPGEGAFAASGTCLIAHSLTHAWFVTGGAKTSRVFHSPNRGRNWTVSETPLAAGKDSAGIFSIAFKTTSHALLAGGDYREMIKEGAFTLATTDDEGRSWKLVRAKLPFLSAVTWAKDRYIAAGTSGSFQSPDGTTWQRLDSENYNALSFTHDGEGWAVGPKGRIAKFTR